MVAHFFVICRAVIHSERARALAKVRYVDTAALPFSSTAPDIKKSSPTITLAELKLAHGIICTRDNAYQPSS